VIRFMNGYMVTTESEDAPSRILTVGGETSNREDMTPPVPVPVELGQDSQPCAQLDPEEPDSLRNVHVSVRNRTRFSSLYNPNSSPATSQHQTPKTTWERLTNTLVQIPIPHIIDRTPRSSHNERADSEEA